MINLAIKREIHIIKNCRFPLMEILPMRVNVNNEMKHCANSYIVNNNKNIKMRNFFF